MASLMLSIDNFHKLKSKYPDKSEDDLIKLSVLMHNSPNKAYHSKTFVDFYLREGQKINYFDDVKMYSKRYLK